MIKKNEIDKNMTEAKRLLSTIKELSKHDAVVKNSLSMVEQKLIKEYERSNVYNVLDRDYIDQAIIENGLLEVARNIIIIQTQRCKELGDIVLKNVL